MENNFQFRSAAVSDRGLNEKRPQNEDSYLLLEQKGVFAVADGVGGAQAGDVASQMTVEILGEAFVNFSDNVDPEQVMRTAIERANQAVFQMAGDLPQLSAMATTIAAVHVSGNIATIAHVGDSRVYRIDPEGYLHRETNDHSVVEEEVRAGRMTAEQAANHPSRNVISRAVGAESSVDVEIRTIMIEPGTIFMLCSDGVTRHINDDEIGRLLTTGMQPELICEHIKELCYERGAEDNLTAIIVKTLVPEFAAVNAPPVATELQPQIETETFAALDVEEETVASARSPFDETIDQLDVAAAAEIEPPVAESPYAAAFTEPDESDAYLMEEPTDTEIVAPIIEPEPYISSSVVVQAQQPVTEREFGIFGSNTAVEAVPEKSAPSVVSKALSALVWLVLGGIIGIGGYYMWNQSNMVQQIAEPTPQLIPKSNDIQVSALEESRRLVDTDPQAYLNAKAASPDDAADHYLLGRALLLTGKYFEAKRQFAIAKEKLPQADPKEAKTLTAEIAMANALIESGPATEAFKKELAGSAAPNANTNSAAPPQ